MKYILLILLLNYHLQCNAQFEEISRQPKLNLTTGTKPRMDSMNGVCEFKLGKTNTKFIDTIAKRIKKNIIRHSKKYSFSYEELKHHIYELEVDSLDNLSFSHPKHPKHRVFVFSDFAMCNHYELGEVKLDFYDDILYKVSIKGNSFIFDFIEKYGMPETEKLPSKHLCDLPTGDNIEFDDESERMQWNNDDIIAVYLDFAVRDRKTCKITYDISFSIYNKYLNTLVNQLDEETKQAANRKNKQERSGLLKKL